MSADRPMKLQVSGVLIRFELPSLGGRPKFSDDLSAHFCRLWGTNQPFTPGHSQYSFAPSDPAQQTEEQQACDRSESREEGEERGEAEGRHKRECEPRHDQRRHGVCQVEQA